MCWNGHIKAIKLDTVHLFPTPTKICSQGWRGPGSTTLASKGLLVHMQGEAGNYLKIAAVSIYAFDYLQTLPAEIRFYRRQRGFCQTSVPCWLLIAVRYLGMLGILLSLVGTFATTFTAESCAHFFLSVPIVKVLGGVASQAVFIYRTYALCNRSRKVLIFLLAFGGLLGVAEIIAPVVVPRNEKLGKTGNCVSDLSKGSTSWIQYMCQVIFDSVILAITGYRLFEGVSKQMITRSDFTRKLWETQLMYFVAVTIVNILNLIFFVKYNHMYESTTFASLGMAITAIYSSRVILDLQEMRNPSWSPESPFDQGSRPAIRTSMFHNDSILDHRWRVKTDVTNTENMKGEPYAIDTMPHSQTHSSEVIQVYNFATATDPQPAAAATYHHQGNNLHL